MTLSFPRKTAPSYLPGKTAQTLPASKRRPKEWIRHRRKSPETPVHHASQRPTRFHVAFKPQYGGNFFTSLICRKEAGVASSRSAITWVQQRAAMHPRSGALPWNARIRANVLTHPTVSDGEFYFIYQKEIFGNVSTKHLRNDRVNIREIAAEGLISRKKTRPRGPCQQAMRINCW